LKSEFETFANFGDYVGPSSFTTMLVVMGQEQGIEVAGVSARASIYINDLNSKACYDLLKNVINMTGFRIDLSDLRQAGEKLVEMLDSAFSENSKASAQLKKLEEVYDGVFGKEPLQGPGEEYDKLLEEMRKMKKEGRKPH
jgi:proteasome assembly chaperone (PAC2) family protein